MPFITSENAAELGRRSGELRRNKSKAIALPKPELDPYTAQILTRTRKQVKSTLDMLESETDPQKIDRLASALARLNEIERQLANRPLPGSLKPTQRPTKPAWTPAVPQIPPTGSGQTPSQDPPTT